MERRSFQTPLGEVWLWGEAEAFESRTPCVVMLTGAFAAPGAMRAFPSLLPGVPVLIGDMPGNRCPWLSEQSVGAFAAAYSTVLQALERPVVLAGSSIGGTVALSVRAPNLRYVLALDPVLSTDGAAVLWPGFRGALERGPSPLRDFLWNVFGLDEERAEPRDYRAILDGLAIPALVLVGSDAGAVPSLVTEDDRTALRACAMVRFRTVLGVGHDLTLGASSVVLEGLRTLARANQQDQDTPRPASPTRAAPTSRAATAAGG